MCCSCRVLHTTAPRLEINIDLPTIHETREAIKSLKNNKSAGPDNIVAEMLKADIESAAENLLPIIHKIWQQEDFQRDWKNGYIAVLPKDETLSDCNKYRGIMLLSIPGKVLSRISRVKHIPLCKLYRLLQSVQLHR